MDFSVVLLYAPSLFHCILWIISDWYFYKIIKELYGKSIAVIALLVYSISWYPNLLMIKTLSNTIESSLLTMAIYFWMRITGKDNKIIDCKAIYLTVIITISFILRNTSIIPWLIPMAWKVLVHKTFLKFVF
mmetsp:Transcript_7613/g.8593  ORF Transcript_7613/g.8593 Transcript_7613/m.8593 type:complete len:132 (+) Transcript_7613:292-687(+)